MGISGQGVETTSYLIGNAFLREGYYPIIFPETLIKEIGKPVSFEIYISKERKYTRDKIFDIALILDKSLYEKNKEKVRKGGIIILNSNKKYEEKDRKIYVIDISSISGRLLGKELLSTSALGVLAGILGSPRLNSCLDSIREVFTGTTLQKNIEIFERTYELARKMVI